MPSVISGAGDAHTLLGYRRVWGAVGTVVSQTPSLYCWRGEMGNFRLAPEIERGEPRIGLGTRWQLASPPPLVALILVKKEILEIVHG